MKPFKISLELPCEVVSVIAIPSKRKSIGLKIRSDDRSITVRFPQHIKRKVVLQFLDDRINWIEKNLADIRKRPPAASYKNSTEYYYLGKPYPIHISQSYNDDSTLVFEDDIFKMTLHDLTDTDQLKSLMLTWYGRRARHEIAQRFLTHLPAFKKIGVEPISLKFRRMKARWGSCSKDGKILLNSELIRASWDCIDYVIIHELCHLVHHNHSKAFYDLQSVMCPEWKILKKVLAEVPIQR